MCKTPKLSHTLDWKTYLQLLQTTICQYIILEKTGPKTTLTHFRSLISSSAVSVNVGALFTTFRATKPFVLHADNYGFQFPSFLEVSFSVMLSWELWRLYSHHIPAEPYSGKVTPSQLLLYLVSVGKHFPNLYRVITACNVIEKDQREDISHCILILFQRFYVILPTNAIVCRILLLLFKANPRPRWIRTIVGSWRAVELFASFRNLGFLCVSGVRVDGWVW